MKKILFNGFYGYKNTGDDAFIEIASWGNNHFWKNTNAPYFTGEHLPETSLPIKRIYPEKCSNKIIQKISVFNATLNSDCFINAGGSVFSEIRPLSNIAFAKRANIINKQLIQGAIGVSIGPFQSIEDEKSTKKYLQKLSFLALRDKRSYDYATSLNLNYKPINAFDLAALLPQCFKNFDFQDKQNVSSPKKTIGISICNYERYYNGDLSNEKKRNQFVTDLLNKLSKNNNFHFKFFIFNGNQKIGDEKLTHETISKIKSDNISILPYTGNVQKVWDEIKTCDFILSTRLHASIFSCYANIPFMLIEYHRKCTDFLQDIGYDKGLQIGDAQSDTQSVYENIIQILDGKYNYPTNLENTIERALLNFTKVQL